MEEQHVAKMKPKAQFVKAGTACKPGWRKKVIIVRGSKRELCLAPKK
jgi:hypothetical protein